MNYSKNKIIMSNKLHITQTKIEQTVLASFLKDNMTENLYRENLKYLQDINKEIFTTAEHKHILEVFQYLDKKNYDIESLLLETKLDERLQKTYIEILTTSAVSNINNYIKILKENYQTTQIQKEIIELNKLIAQGGALDTQKVISKLSELQELNSTPEKKPRNEKLRQRFRDLSTKSSQLKDIKVEYLNKLIVKNEITMIAAKPGIGKSLTTLAMVNEFLQKDKTIEDVFYFDMDNSESTLAERDLGKILDQDPRLCYLLGSNITQTELDRSIKELCNTDLSNCVVIFDSAKNFMAGGDRDKNKDVSKVTEIFKQMRNNGATIIFLHHTNKPQKDLDSLYAGSSAWGEDITNGFILDKNEEKETFIFTNSIKNRTGKVPKKIAFKYKDNLLHEVDLEKALLTSEDEEMLEDIRIYLLDNAQAPQNRTQNKIVKYLTNEGYGRNHCVRLLHTYIDKNWTLIPQAELNGRKVYTALQIISKEPTITVYKNDENQQNHTIPQKTAGQVGQWDTPSLSGFENPIYQNPSGTGGTPIPKIISQLDIEIPDIF